VEHVMGQDAVSGKTDEGHRHLLQWRKQLAREDAEMRGDFPGDSHDQERKRGARNDAPMALAMARGCPGGEDMRWSGTKSGHKLTIVPTPPARQASSEPRSVSVEVRHQTPFIPAKAGSHGQGLGPRCGSSRRKRLG